jgi:hypothetical protein
LVIVPVAAEDTFTGRLIVVADAPSAIAPA